MALIRIPRTSEEWKREIQEWVRTIVVVMLIFLPTVTFVVQGYRIPSGSMEDTLLVGDFLFADKITFGARIPFTDGVRGPGLRKPRPGDIVIFKSPRTGQTLIKRCVAVEGQIVEMREKKLYIDGRLVYEPYVKHTRPYVDPYLDNYGPVRIPKDHIFCLGDNRDQSSDSRVFGPVPLKLVIAKADILYFSIDTKRIPPLPRIWRIGKPLWNTGKMTFAE